MMYGAFQELSIKRGFPSRSSYSLFYCWVLSGVTKFLWIRHSDFRELYYLLRFTTLAKELTIVVDQSNSQIPFNLSPLLKLKVPITQELGIKQIGSQCHKRKKCSSGDTHINFFKKHQTLFCQKGADTTIFAYI
ncbi:hypothetical protein GmHk_20G058158 [Glycine max]|nr:hypothetical protein GmHk_20G058158 [Glycine max]